MNGPQRGAEQWKILGPFSPLFFFPLPAVYTNISLLFSFSFFFLSFLFLFFIFIIIRIISLTLSSFYLVFTSIFSFLYLHLSFLFVCIYILFFFFTFLSFSVNEEWEKRRKREGEREREKRKRSSFGRVILLTGAVFGSGGKKEGEGEEGGGEKQMEKEEEKKRAKERERESKEMSHGFIKVAPNCNKRLQHKHFIDELIRPPHRPPRTGEHVPALWAQGVAGYFVIQLVRFVGRIPPAEGLLRPEKLTANLIDAISHFNWCVCVNDLNPTDLIECELVLTFGSPSRRIELAAQRIQPAIVKIYIDMMWFNWLSPEWVSPVHCGDDLVVGKCRTNSIWRWKLYGLDSSICSEWSEVELMLNT